jgi:hypothetical protein
MTDPQGRELVRTTTTMRDAFQALFDKQLGAPVVLPTKAGLKTVPAWRVSRREKGRS